MKKTKIKVNKPIYLGFSILEISKMLMYGFWHDFIKQYMIKMQNFVTQILTALLFKLKLKIFMKILQIMLQKDLAHQIINAIDQCLQKKKQEKDWVNER